MEFEIFRMVSRKMWEIGVGGCHLVYGEWETSLSTTHHTKNISIYKEMIVG